MTCQCNVSTDCDSSCNCVFVLMEEQVGCSPACQGVTLGKSAAENWETSSEILRRWYEEYLSEQRTAPLRGWNWRNIEPMG